MPANTDPAWPVLVPGETRNLDVSFADKLASGESLTGTPTITEVTTTDLTITNKAVSTTALTINGESVASGAALQFTVAGQLAARAVYCIKLVCGTNATKAQILIRYKWFDVADR